MVHVHWISAPTVSNAARDTNAQIVRTLGLPYHKGAGRLAVVGGGNSIRRNIEELRNWNGGIWAVNGTVNWCLDNGIDAAFYTIDAQPPERWAYDLTRMRRAIVAEDCNPDVIRLMLSNGVDVSLLTKPDGGPTSAAAADLLSLQSGYTHISFFGCEGSFEEDTHAYTSTPVADWIEAVVGGEHFRTKPEYAQQSQIISEVIRTFPYVYADRSGGLLSAMVRHGGEYDVYAVSHQIYAQFEKNAQREAA